MDDSGFQPVLKPYQLVGVNFLMLLYRKKVAGGMYSIYSHAFGLNYINIYEYGWQTKMFKSIHTYITNDSLYTIS